MKEYKIGEKFNTNKGEKKGKIKCGRGIRERNMGEDGIRELG